MHGAACFQADSPSPGAVWRRPGHAGSLVRCSRGSHVAAVWGCACLQGHAVKSHRHTDLYDIEPDLSSLSTLTSEVKAIANQAVILHGERIKRAQEILKKYRDGAFTAWLFATYGNRQTPYNFLQYYEFYTTLPSNLHPLIDQMPRQAVYSLASRGGAIERKTEIVRNYSGQSKQELLTLIRQEFPLTEDDKRHPNLAAHAIQLLKRSKELLKNRLCVPSVQEKKQIQSLLLQLQGLLDQ